MVYLLGIAALMLDYNNIEVMSLHSAWAKSNSAVS